MCPRVLDEESSDSSAEGYDLNDPQFDYLLNYAPTVSAATTGGDTANYFDDLSSSPSDSSSD